MTTQVRVPSVNLPQSVEPRQVTLKFSLPSFQNKSQEIRASLNVRGSIHRVEYANHLVQKVLFVDFNGSFASPGSPVLDQDDARALFIDRVLLEAWLQPTADGLHDDKLVPGYNLAQVQPLTTNQSGSITSSIDWSVNANAGAFGDEPTGGVGAGLSISSSHSHQLQDFVFRNDSTAQIVKHTIAMQQLGGDGGEYEGLQSLVNEWQSPLVGARLRELPGLAKSDVPIPTQAIWINNANEHLIARAQLSVRLTLHFSGVEASANGFVINSSPVGVTQAFPFGIPIDFTLVDR